MRRSTPIADWRLERYLLKELPQNEWQQIEVLLSQDEQLRARLDALRREDELVHERYPAAWMARQIETRVDASQPQAHKKGEWSLWWRWSPAVAIVLTLAALPMLQSPDPSIVSPAATRIAPAATRTVPSPRLREQVRIKGDGPRLLLHRSAGTETGMSVTGNRKAAAGSTLLEKGAVAAEGDLVMIQYDAAGANYGLIISVDGSGVLTRHYPLEGQQAVSLGHGVVALEYAYELDAAPHWECFYLVTSDTAFDSEPILASIESMVIGPMPPTTLPLSDALQQNQWILLKEAGGQ
jgi:hypothetical protein